ncbi:MAG: DUF1223 domain-containing protein [Pseudomonadota bacterium]
MNIKLALGIVVGAAAFVATANTANARMTVLELFTSQGCSSCPPADELLGEIAQDNEDILALSMPVDYWDYLGWKDSLASPKHSARQRAYAEARGDMAVYTPQIVVNGERHVIGSDGAAVAKTVNALNTPPVDVAFTKTGSTLTVKLPDLATSDAGPLRVWVVGFSVEEPVSIGRGENAGRTVSYHNVVRKMVDLGAWDGTSKTLSVKSGDVMMAGNYDCAVIIQRDVEGGAGPIIGATRLALAE